MEKAFSNAANDFVPARSSANVYIMTAGGYALLLKRSPHKLTNPDVWGLPGGKIEAYETPQEAALREVHEETGLKSSHCEKVQTIDDDYKSKRYEYMMIRAPRIFEPTLNPEHTDYLWVHISELPEYPEIQERIAAHTIEIGPQKLLNLRKEKAAKNEFEAA